MTRAIIRGILIVICLYYAIEYYDGVVLNVSDNNFSKAFLITSLLFLADEFIAFPIFNKFFTPPSFSLTYEFVSFVFSVLNVYIIEKIYGPFVIESFLAVVVLTLVLMMVRAATTKSTKPKK